MYLSSMNQLTQTMIANEANNKNLTQNVDVPLKALDDLKVEVRYTNLSMLDIHSKKDLERLNGSIMQIIEERISDYMIISQVCIKVTRTYIDTCNKKYPISYIYYSFYFLI